MFLGSLPRRPAGRPPVDGWTEPRGQVGHSLLLASHSLRSISLGSTTSSLRSKSTTRIFVYSCSKYCFFSSVGGFFPFGFVLDFLQHKKRQEESIITEWLFYKHALVVRLRQSCKDRTLVRPKPGTVCVVAQRCHVTPVLHFQGCNPPQPPSASAEAVQPGVKGERLSAWLRTELQLSGCCVSNVWTNINCPSAALLLCRFARRQLWSRFRVYDSGEETQGDLSCRRTAPPYNQCYSVIFRWPLDRLDIISTE